MTRFRALLPLAVAAIAFGLGAGLPAPAAAAPVSVKPPLLQVHERRLGNAAAFGPEVARQLGAFETIPAAELDPLAPGLRRPAAAAPPPGG